MTQNLQIKLKITDFLLGFGICNKRLLVGIGVLHMYTNFRTCTWNVARGALRWKCIGGAIEPFCHTHFWNIYQMSIFASSEVCAKFRDFSSMFRPSKMRLGLEKKNKNNNNNNNNNKQSRFNRVLAPSVLGP